MKVLYLSLKKKWYDMILSGEKKEEYREVKPYWINRLTKKECHNLGTLETIHKLADKNVFRDDFDVIEFSHGYTKGRRIMRVELIGMHYGFPTNINWVDGIKSDNFYLCIELGKILSTNHYL